MSTLKRLTTVALVLALGIPLSASGAHAAYWDHDPNDTDSPFDISGVHSAVTPGGRVMFTVQFYDRLEWHRNSSVWVYLDSRAGPSVDFLLIAGVQNGREDCYLHEVATSNTWPAGVDIGPRKVACDLPKRLLRPSGAIRWFVRTLYWQGGHVVSDWAPRRFGVWYPHV